MALTVTCEASPQAGGSVRYHIDDSSSPSTHILSVYVTVNQGYRLTRWVAVDNYTTFEGDARDVEGDGLFFVNAYSESYSNWCTVTCYFTKEVASYDLDVYVSVSPLGSGSASASPASFRNVPVGTTSRFSLTATPADGYLFDHWERDETGATSTSNPWSGTSTPSSPGEYERNYTAYFRRPSTCSFLASVSPEGSGLVNGATSYSVTFTEGDTTSVSVTAEPKPGFVFYRWVKDGTTKTVRTATLERTLTASESWTAEFTTSIIRIPISVIPGASEHGQHGQVVVTDYTTKVSRTFVESGVFDATPRTSLTNPTLYASVSMLATVSGSEYKIVRYVFRNGDHKGISLDSVDAESSSFVDGERIKVFFGCGKLLHKKDTDDLLEHDGRLVYCG